MSVRADELEHGADRHLVAERPAAAAQRYVPVEPVVAAVDGRVELQTKAGGAEWVLDWSGEHSAQLHRAGDPLDRKLRDRRYRLVVDVDHIGCHANFGVMLGVKEVRGEKVAGQGVVANIDVAHGSGAREAHVLAVRYQRRIEITQLATVGGD